MTAPTQHQDTAQLLAELTSAAAAVRGNSWLAAGLGRSSAAVGLLGSSTSPLSSLSGAGLGWFTPYVSFLEEPFNQLRGNPGSVSSGAQEFQDAGQSVSSLASSYRDATGSQTGTWTGSAASSYRDTGSQAADGISALGEAGSTVAGAIAAAGEVVGQAVEAITALATEAIGKIVPIMTQAVAAAPSTFGQSIVAAIPQCVQIAVDCGQKILAKLAALLTSGQNLLKLVQGALAVVKVVKQVLSQIGSQSSQGTQQTTDGKAKNTSTQAASDTQQQKATGEQTQSQSSGTGSAGSAVPTSGSTPASYSPGSSSRAANQSTGLNSMPRPGSYVDAVAPANTRTVPTGFTGTSSAPTGFGGGGGFGVVPGAAGPAGVTGGSGTTGERRKLGVGPVTGAPGKDMTAGRAPTAAGTTAGGMFGSPAGMGAAGEQDKEHQRKYSLTEHDDDLFGELDESVVIAPNVIGEA
ncbi:hypothetical protein ALI144C_41030 [Actinosynnema sp. ALI-1.44]|uniref:hypothetical protein n=1 Tax=Actinosynnema sp. ALI-1.44 TaxID=1933779 RepID=UPI00097C4768|nr:hypothetical protein [Actinosynnema sp. ALI-1.44]ONI75134.1 hypothetical protein ALI144C_41030 [Actinosynnema sp. ALI-1.44]